MRFSSRLDWAAHPNELSRLLAEKRACGAEVLDLTESNPTRAELEYPSDAILRALADARALQYDPTPLGLESAREAVAGYYRTLGAAVQPDRILLTASTSEAYAYLFKLLCDPGDEVLSPQPSYPLFEYLAGLESVRVRPYPLRYDGAWHIDFAALEEAIQPRSRAVILVNPNNPTGSFLKVEERDRLQAICEEYGLAIISDEVFADFGFAAESGFAAASGFAEDARRVTTLAGGAGPLRFALSGLSKIAGLPQLKLGWMAVAGDGSEAAMARLEVIVDTFLSVGTPVQAAAPALLEVSAAIRKQIRQRTAANLAWLRSAVAGHACQLLHLEGGWYATLQVPATQSEEQWTIALLRDRGVLVQPGYFYDFGREAFLIVSLLTPPAVFESGMRRLLASL